MSPKITRRGLIAGLGYATLAGGTAALATSATARSQFFRAGEGLTYRAQRLLTGDALAREFDAAQMSPEFRTNGNVMPASADYQAHMAAGFADWALRVEGLVTTPQTFTLAQLQAMEQRTQITRHDCVEGWSAIGKWTGVPLRALLNRVELTPTARFIVFHCADDFSGRPYYESIDLADAYHPQTILAHRMNDQPLSVGHGAPIRLRVERQLGYKHAKYVMRIEAVASLEGIGLGGGGLWEDIAGYEWYAGI